MSILNPPVKREKYGSGSSAAQKNLPSYVESAEEMGIVGSETTITGSISTKGHLAVHGIVCGDVTVSGSLLLTGEIRGNIRCGNAIFDGCSNYSRVIADGNVSVKKDSVMHGAINCANISVMGSVYSDINASGNVGISSSATVKGDISGIAIAIEPGAQFEGQLKIKNNVVPSVY